MLLANTMKARDGRPAKSWPERVVEVLREIFVPSREPVPVPVVVRPGGPVRRP